MAVNRGKQFEQTVQEAFEKVPHVSVIRVHDQTSGYLGSKNPCDFIIYHKPYLYTVECKSVHGNTLPIYSKDPKKMYGNISNFQWEQLLRMGDVKGVTAGVLCWWIDKDVTMFLPIRMLEAMRNDGAKSIRYDCDMYVTQDSRMFNATMLTGKKKRVLYDYNVVQFLKEMEG